MELVIKVDEIGMQECVFDKSGRMVGEPVKIVLRNDAKRHCFPTALRIPFLFMPKVKAELDRLEHDGSLSRCVRLLTRCKEKWQCTHLRGLITS